MSQPQMWKQRECEILVYPSLDHTVVLSKVDGLIDQELPIDLEIQLLLLRYLGTSFLL